MKYPLMMLLTAGLFAAACSNDKPVPADVKAAEEQVSKDQAAMDSMEKIIEQQIEAVSDDSLMQVEHWNLHWKCAMQGLRTPWKTC